MRIAIATDRDFVASHFGCCPMFTIVDVENGTITHSFVVPNPGCNHAFWLDLCLRNAVTHVVAGRMGPSALSIFRGRDIRVLTGIEGAIAEVAARVDRGELRSAAPDGEPASTCCACQN